MKKYRVMTDMFKGIKKGGFITPFIGTIKEKLWGEEHVNDEISQEFIDRNPELFEEVKDKEKTWEATKMAADWNGNIVTGRPTEVRRLSDGEVFRIGDMTQYGRIELFSIKGEDTLFVDIAENLPFSRDIEDLKKVGEKKWEIIAFSHNVSGCIFKKSNIKDHFTSDGIGNYYIDTLLKMEKVKIYSVKRLSDGEEFKVGDEAFSPNGSRAIHKIEEFIFDKNKDNLWVRWDNDGGGNWLNAIQKAPKKPIAKTEDGCDVYHGHTVWGVAIQASKGNEIIEKKFHYPTTVLPTNRKWFKEKSAGEKYLIENKQCFSYNDIISFVNLSSFQSGTLQRRAKERIGL